MEKTYLHMTFQIQDELYGNDL